MGFNGVNDNFPHSSFGEERISMGGPNEVSFLCMLTIAITELVAFTRRLCLLSLIFIFPNLLLFMVVFVAHSSNL